MFLWTILQKSESDLVRKCLMAQQINPVKNDLATTFQNDLEMCNITLTMSDISKTKKSKFRKLVNTQIRCLANEYLLNLKRKHSKLDQVSNTYSLEKYLKSSNISTEEKQTLFRFRTRMADVKCNFKNQYGRDLTCYFCSNEDTQSHILFCKELISDMNTSGVHDEHTFSDSITEQENVAKLLDKILKKRILKIKLLSTDKNFSH